MTIKTPDVIVIGLGAMGSAVTYQLAKCGVNVIGIDRFTPPHQHGSTHGETRITREAIGEGLQFVPLAMRSHKLWREIESETESETGAELLKQCGGVIIKRAGTISRWHGQDDFLGNTFRAAEQFGIAHERLDTAAIAARFPQFILQGDELGYYEPGAGYLNPEACVSAQLLLAKRYGASLRFGETVRTLTNENGATEIETDSARYAAKTTIVCAGAWIPQLLPTLSTKLTVSRQVLTWFELDGNHGSTWKRSATDSADAPIFIWQWGAGLDEVSYGFPQIGDAREMKLGTEQQLIATNPDDVQREVSDDEIKNIFDQHVSGKLRGVTARCTRAVTCLYTSTRNANFIIRRLPDAENMIVVSACSGHGFKHSAAIGEAVAEMAITKITPKVLQPFLGER